MDVAVLLLELFGRIPPLAREVVDAVSTERLTESLVPGANSIAWLVWHTARVQDCHVSELLDGDQVWVEGDWAAGFGLTADPYNSGYGNTAEEMQAVRPVTPGVLLDYLDAVDRRTRAFLEGLSAADLDRVVDRNWDPAVTMGVRLVSIADDSLQHLGQAAYVAGVLR